MLFIVNLLVGFELDWKHTNYNGCFRFLVGKQEIGNTNDGVFSSFAILFYSIFEFAQFSECYYW